MRESVMGIQKDHPQKLFSKIFCMLVCMFLLASCAPGAQEAAPNDSLPVWKRTHCDPPANQHRHANGDTNSHINPTA